MIQTGAKSKGLAKGIVILKSVHEKKEKLTIDIHGAAHIAEEDQSAPLDPPFLEVEEDEIAAELYILAKEPSQGDLPAVERVTRPSAGSMGQGAKELGEGLAQFLGRGEGHLLQVPFLVERMGAVTHGGRFPRPGWVLNKRRRGPQRFSGRCLLGALSSRLRCSLRGGEKRLLFEEEPPEEFVEPLPVLSPAHEIGTEQMAKGLHPGWVDEGEAPDGIQKG